MSVYTFYADPGADYGRRADPIDGDRNKVWPVGFDFHPVTHAARLEDGTSVKKSSIYQGVPVDATHLPKKVRVGGGKAPPVDVITHNGFIVSDKFRQVLDQLEPGHQFAPTELVWKDGSHAASYFWFYPCNRIDCLDREHTTHELRGKSGLWMQKPGGHSVHSLYVAPWRSAVSRPST